MYLDKLMRLALNRRNVTDDDITALNDPSHEKLTNVDKLADALHEDKLNNKKILIMSDFDMDGIASGTIFFAGLSELGFRVSLYIPTPADGYGLGTKAAAAAAKTFPDTDVILTSDVGIQENIDDIKAPFKKDIKVYVTDHHQPDRNGMPKADICVDPYAVGDTYVHKDICGAYVAYQVLQDYAARHGSIQDQEDISRLALFAGLGTVSDSMPMLYENRSIVKQSLTLARMLSGTEEPIVFGTAAPYINAFNGFRELMLSLKEKGKIPNGADSVTEELYGYYIAPMFNSVKRLDGDMSKAFGVFFDADPQNDIQYLYEENDKRKEKVKETYDEILSDPQPYAPYAYITDADAGLCGLLANKFMGESGFPTVVVRDNGRGGYSGSARSPESFKMLEELNTNIKGASGAGHEYACGVSFTDKASLNDYYKTVSGMHFVTHVPTPEVTIAPDGSGDSTINLDLFHEYLEDKQSMAPFGPGFEEPLFAVKFKISDATNITYMGSNESHAKVTLPEDKAGASMPMHAKVTLPNAFPVLMWNMADQVKDLEKTPNATVYAIGHLEESTFRGQTEIQFNTDVLVKEKDLINIKDICKDNDEPLEQNNTMDDLFA